MTSSADQKQLEITFWGTRGTLPSPGKQFERAGGNTNCVSVRCGNHTIVFDAGTGVRELGRELAAKDPDHHLHLFLTHAHYDHVEGIPFFAPFFIEGRKIDVYCGELDGSPDTEDTVKNLMRRPYFPVSPDVFTADVDYINLQKNEGFDLGDGIKISSTPLNHPGGATGYRIDFEGKSFACITDTEHVPGTHDENILKIIDGVDAFMYDCSLKDVEFPNFVGYGHSTYEEAIRLQKLSSAGDILATHHMPFRQDVELDEIEKKMGQSNEKFRIAREGDKIIL